MQGKTIHGTGFLLLIGVLLLSHCGLVEYNFNNPFSGITETDSEGNVITADADDWRLVSNPTSTLPPGEAPEVRPAFPNPASSSIKIFLRIQQPVDDVDIHILNRQEQTVHVIQKGFLPVGVYNFQWDLDDDSGRNLENDIYRCEISFTQNGFQFSSYGDIKIER